MIRAPRDGVVKSVLYAVGDFVEGRLHQAFDCAMLVPITSIVCTLVHVTDRIGVACVACFHDVVGGKTVVTFEEAESK